MSDLCWLVHTGILINCVVLSDPFEYPLRLFWSHKQSDLWPTRSLASTLPKFWYPSPWHNSLWWGKGGREGEENSTQKRKDIITASPQLPSPEKGNWLLFIGSFFFHLYPIAYTLCWESFPINRPWFQNFLLHGAWH